MKTIFVLLLTCGIVVSQSNLYWQEGFFPQQVFTVKSFSKEKHVYFEQRRPVRITENNFKTFEDISDFDVRTKYPILYDHFALYSSDNGEMIRCDLENKTSENLGIFNANIYLKCSDSLFYIQTSGGDIFKSTTKGTSWDSVLTLPIIKSWIYNNHGDIFLIISENKLFKTDSLFSEIILLSEDIEISPVADEMYISGKDTLLLLGNNKLYRTFDGGSSFTYSEFDNILAGIKSDWYGNIYFMSGYRLEKSTDYGESWETIFFDNFARGNIHTFEDYLYLAYSSYYRAYFYDPDFVPVQYNNYFPLEVGNKWFYRAIGYSLGTATMEVTDSLIYNGKKYFIVTLYDFPLRYEDNKILFLEDGEEKVYLDFNVNQGNPVFSHKIGIHMTMLEDTKTFFGEERFCKGPCYIEMPGTMSEMYSPGFGKVFCSDIFYGVSRIEPLDTVLVQAVIDTGDGVVEYNSVPLPTYPNLVDFITNGDSFVVRMDVKHSYSRINSVQDFNFVNYSYMEYFYQKGDSSTSIDTLYGSRTKHSITYTFNGKVDRELVLDGYLFRYRFVSSALGVIPQISIFPEEDYLTAVIIIVSNPQLTEHIFDYSLKSNYPNPFNPSTTISYTIRENSRVVLEVYNIQGQMVRRLVEENQEAGEHTAVFDGENLASGVYIARLRAVSQTGREIFTRSIKMILMK